MDIVEIKALKRQTEKDIRALLIAFCEATGLPVEQITFECMGVHGVAGQCAAHITSVEMEVKI